MPGLHAMLQLQIPASTLAAHRSFDKVLATPLGAVARQSGVAEVKLFMR